MYESSRVGFLSYILHETDNGATMGFAQNRGNVHRFHRDGL